MSLDWNLSDIPDHETLCWQEVTEDRPYAGLSKGEHVLNPVTEALIWNCMAIGMGTITVKNLDQYVLRTMFYESLMGARRKRVVKNDLGISQLESVPLTYAEIAQHVGLRTNVALETEAAFTKRMWVLFARENQQRLRV